MKTCLQMTLAFVLLASSPVQAAQGKEFITSVIYGTLAGTLVGAATLAFTSNPSDNLNNVARGSSYGLYTGILLGLYVTYGVNDNSPDEHPGEQGPGYEEGYPQDGQPQQPVEVEPEASLIFSPRNFALYPIVPQNPQQGWGVGVQLLNIKF